MPKQKKGGISKSEHYTLKYFEIKVEKPIVKEIPPRMARKMPTLSIFRSGDEKYF